MAIELPKRAVSWVPPLGRLHSIGRLIVPAGLVVAARLASALPAQ
jgi:hypothetical protein